MSLRRQERFIDDIDRQAENEGRCVGLVADRRLMIAKGLDLTEARMAFEDLFAVCR
jgi:hypothetical protein